LTKENRVGHNRGGDNRRARLKRNQRELKRLAKKADTAPAKANKAAPPKA
jgi:hypothetical protein